MAKNALAEMRAPSAALRAQLVLVARFGLPLLAASAVGLFVAAAPPLYAARSTPPEAVRAGLGQLGLSAGFYAAYYTLVQVAFALVCLGIAAVVAWHRRDEGMALFTSLLLVLLGTTNHPNMRALVEHHPSLAVPATLGVSLAFAASILFLFLFPDGRFVPRGLLAPVGVGIVALLVAWFLPGSSLADPPSLAGLLALAGYGLGVVAQGYRYRRVSGPVQRQQA